MKKVITILAVGALLFTSCKKEVEMCINGNMTPSDVGVQTYSWCGENADVQNSESIEWYVGNDIYYGTEVMIDWKSKGAQSIYVHAKNKKHDSEETYTVNVGTYGSRVEPMACTSSNLTGNYKLYIYADISNLQSDIRNGDKANCLDSSDFANTYYLNGIVGSNEGLAVSLPSLTFGNYLLYVVEINNGVDPYAGSSNLLEIMISGNTNFIYQNNGDMENISNTVVNTMEILSGNQFMMDFVSKTWLLTDVWVDGTNAGVSACNADDNMIIDIDRTWLYDVGLDDCSGNQTNSAGIISVPSNCNNFMSGPFTLSNATGSLSTASSISIQVASQTTFNLVSVVGANTIVQEFTVQ